jgi:hypothetical protein
MQQLRAQDAFTEVVEVEEEMEQDFKSSMGR